MKNKLKLSIGAEEYESGTKFAAGDRVWYLNEDRMEYVKIYGLNISQYHELGHNWPDDKNDFKYEIKVEYQVYSEKGIVLAQESDLYTLDGVREYLLDKVESRLEKMRKEEYIILKIDNDKI